MLLCALGCGGSNKTVGPQPIAEPTVLTISCPDEVAETVIKRYGQAWAAQHNVRLDFVRTAAQDGPEARAGVDLAIVPTSSLPGLAKAGQLRPVPEKLHDRDGGYRWQDLLPLYRNKLLAWDGKAYALPLLGSASVCYYRDDLFTDTTHQAAFREKYARALAAPTTWEEYADVAEFFRNRGGLGAASLPPLPEKVADLDRLFYTVAASYVRRTVREDEPRQPGNVELFSFHYDLDTLRPRLDTPGFVHGLKLMQRLQACRPPGSAPSPPEAFRDGKAVLCVAGPEWVDRFRKTGSKVRDKFAVCRLPGADFYFDFHTGKPVPAKANFIPYVGSGGWLGAVPTATKQADAAFDLLAYLSGPTTSVEIVIEPAWGGAAFRRDHLTGTSWESFGLGPERTRGLLEAVRGQLAPACVNPAVRLRTPDEAEHLRALTDEIRAALAAPAVDPAQALRTAVRRWEKLDAKKDLALRRKEYRLSLSLAPEAR